MQQGSEISDLHLEMFVFLQCFALQSSPPFHHLLCLVSQLIPVSYRCTCVLSYFAYPISSSPNDLILSLHVKLSRSCRCRLGRYLSHLSQFAVFSSLCPLPTSSLLSLFPCPVLILVFYQEYFFTFVSADCCPLSTCFCQTFSSSSSSSSSTSISFTSLDLFYPDTDTHTHTHTHPPTHTHTHTHTRTRFMARFRTHV